MVEMLLLCHISIFCSKMYRILYFCASCEPSTNGSLKSNKTVKIELSKFQVGWYKFINQCHCQWLKILFFHSKNTIETKNGTILWCQSDFLPGWISKIRKKLRFFLSFFTVEAYPYAMGGWLDTKNCRFWCHKSTRIGRFGEWIDYDEEIYRFFSLTNAFSKGLTDFFQIEPAILLSAGHDAPKAWNIFLST